MNYRRRFLVKSPLAKVVDFHSRADNMAALTPPPILIRFQRTPPVLGEGDEMAFTMWIGPLPARWLARIEDVSSKGFTDRQLHGPFDAWVHRHSFSAVDAQTTQVVDEINLRLRRHIFWGPLGLAMWLGLPVLFAFRALKTRRLLS